MFCTKCGSELRERDKYCAECATPTGRIPQVSFNRQERLRRPIRGRKIAGVCAGVARYLQVDVTAVRIIAVILLFWPVPFVASIGYLIAWMLIPQDPVVWPEVTARGQQQPI
jgi:phage shock protein C